MWKSLSRKGRKPKKGMPLGPGGSLSRELLWLGVNKSLKNRQTVVKIKISLIVVGKLLLLYCMLRGILGETLAEPSSDKLSDLRATMRRLGLESQEGSRRNEEENIIKRNKMLR